MTRQNISLLLIAASFLGWGMLRALNDILAAALQLQHAGNDFHAMQVHFSFFAAYLLVPMPAAWMIRRFGLRAGLVAATAVMGLAALCCVVALRSGLWLPYFLSLFAIAAGIALLQTAGSPAITRLGSIKTASRRLLTLQSVSSTGSAITPLLVGSVFEAAPVITSAAVIYLGVGTQMLLVGISFIWNSQPALAAPTQPTPAPNETFRLSPSLVHTMGSIFLYVGTEATVLSHVLSYRRSYDISGSSWTWAATLASYWILVTVGRWLASSALKTLDLVLLLRIATGGAAALMVMAVLGKSAFGTTALLLTGLFNSAIFPTLYSLCAEGLDLRKLAITSGFLMTAICGGAVIPLCSGLLTDWFGLRGGLLLPLVSYCSIFFTAARCRNIRSA
jgi:FHS family L-fucose permease-like MFS transporter